MRNPAPSFLAATILALLVPAAVHAADIRVFCSGPMQGPLAGLGDTFARDTGHRAELVFAGTPDLLKRLAAGEAADVVLFVGTAFADAVKTGKVMDGNRAEVGRIGVGVVVRAGAASPDISTPDALRRAVLDADSLAFNQRASGTHFANVLERLGIAGEVKGKSRRPDGDAGVFEHIQKGKGKDLGVLSLPPIMADGGKRVSLVGPLPAQLQHYEPYFAGLTTNSKSPDAGRAFIRFLTSPQAKATMAKRGIAQVE